MKNYYCVLLGKRSANFQECLAGSFIGVDSSIPQDLTSKLPEDWRDFNREFIPIYLASNPDKTKIAAGLACGSLWTVAKGINQGDIVISPDGKGHFHVAEVQGNYTFQPGGVLPHRRPVQWLNQTIDRADLSIALRDSADAAGMVSMLTSHGEEIERLIISGSFPQLISTDETVEDPVAFAMEKHLEDFLVSNWSQTELAKEYMIYEVDGVKIGQQYATDTGPLDILAISKDKKTLLIVELKRGRASDVVVGQVLRYMGFVQEQLAEEGQNVKGVIIALEEDQRIRRALSVTPNIEFYRYEISFKLKKV